jgi:dethiobiotin synthetase
VSAQTLFVTGTDTGVGKTHASVAMLQVLRVRGLRACGFKPVASGSEDRGQGLRNDDAEALLAASTPGLNYAQINAYSLAPPIAPHLAAEQAGTTIDLSVLDRAHAALAANHDCVIAEGAGGWAVPLNRTQTFADWVAARQWPVVLVVGLRLGCINHALLSAEAIAARTSLAGWVANTLPPEMPLAAENIASLCARMPAPLWGVIPAQPDTAPAAEALSTMPWPLAR